MQRERYQHATRAEKHRLLNMEAVTGIHRKAGIRLLRRAPRRGRRPGGVDARASTAPRPLLDIWQGSEKTVVFVTHHIDEAVHLADRVIILTARPGRLLDR